jgi:D-inositol-3-phosphate glycosyltransferase
MRQLLLLSLNGDPLGDLGTEHAGGQCRYILEVGKRLVLHDWAITVITIQNPGRLSREEITLDFDVLRVPLRNRAPYDPETCYSQLASLEQDVLTTLAREAVEVDVILGCYWLSALIGLRVAAEMKRRLVVSFSSLAAYKQVTGMSPFMNVRLQAERQIVQQADHVIATTHDEATVLRSGYGIDERKLSIIARGIDLDVFRPLR